MNKSFTLVTMFCAINLQAQKLVTGQLISEKTNTPIEYANIGIINTTVGTFSFEDGSFNLIIPEKRLKDKLTFAAIGYEKKEIAVSNLGSDKLIVSLYENLKVLDEVKIIAKNKIKKGSWGKSLVNFGATGYSCTRGTGGFAIASYISTKEETFHLTKANLYIGLSQLESYMLRVRFQEVTSNNQPGEDLVHKNIIVISGVKKGWVEVDLSQYNIQIKEDFFLVVEWIMDEAGTLKMLEYDANPLSWDIEGSTIAKQETMTYFDESGNKISVALTPEQIEEYRERILPKVYIGTKSRNKRSTSYSYWREGNMAPWFREYDHELLANIEYDY